VIYLKFDPWTGEAIPDGYAEQYAVDIVAAANGDQDGDRIFHVSSHLVVDYFRALVAEKAVDPLKVTIQMRDCPDQFSHPSGRLNHWPRYYGSDQALMRILSAGR
jgi:hypothetical protein